MKKYYTYAYLREDKTPYYIGKGSANRAWNVHRRVSVPNDKSKILILKQNLTEEEAFVHEIYMINLFGRKDLGTGILRNLTDGGDNPPSQKGKIHSEETKKKMSEGLKNSYLLGSRVAYWKGKKAHNAKSVEVFGKVYCSIKKACKDNNIAYSQYLFMINSNLSFKTSDELKRHIWEQRGMKISESKKGKPSTSKGMTGKTHSEETKRKISKARKVNKNRQFTSGG